MQIQETLGTVHMWRTSAGQWYRTLHRAQFQCTLLHNDNSISWFVPISKLFCHLNKNSQCHQKIFKLHTHIDTHMNGFAILYIPTSTTQTFQLWPFWLKLSLARATQYYFNFAHLTVQASAISQKTLIAGSMAKVCGGIISVSLKGGCSKR